MKGKKPHERIERMKFLKLVAIGCRDTFLTRRLRAFPWDAQTVKQIVQL